MKKEHKAPDPSVQRRPNPIPIALAGMPIRWHSVVDNVDAETVQGPAVGSSWRSPPPHPTVDTVRG